MAHLGNGQGIYGKLRKRLDRYPIGAPPAPALYEILKALFSEKEALVASKMPEDVWHRTVLMAIERGKYQNLIFGEPDRIDHAVLRALTRIVISLPPVKKALLAKQVDSRYLQALVG